MASALATKLAKLKKQQAAVEKEMANVAKAAFKEMSVAVFKANPALISFSWSQYTPYWNDGDTCEFSASGDYPTIVFTSPDGKLVKNDENQGELNYIDEDGEVIGDDVIEQDGEFDVVAADDPGTKYAKQIEKLSSKVSKFLSNFTDDDFLTMFGDHTFVTVNRSGKVETEDYEHE